MTPIHRVQYGSSWCGPLRLPNAQMQDCNVHGVMYQLKRDDAHARKQVSHTSRKQSSKMNQSLDTAGSVAKTRTQLTEGKLSSLFQRNRSLSLRVNDGDEVTQVSDENEPRERQVSSQINRRIYVFTSLQALSP